MLNWFTKFPINALTLVYPKREPDCVPVRRRVSKCNRHKPWLESLEKRQLLVCGDTLEPWCRDITAGAVEGFSTDGHAEVNIANRFEEAYAMAIQNVDLGGGVIEQRPLLAGWAKPFTLTGKRTPAIARLCANGHVDDGTDVASGGCGGLGFGYQGTGVLEVDFFPSATDDFGQIHAMLVYDVTATTACGGEVTQRILVAAQINVAANDIGPENEVWGVARICPDGSGLDTNFGGNAQDYEDDPEPGENIVDTAGTVTIVFADNIDVKADWSRFSAPYALAIEPNTKRIVVGGYVAHPPPPEPKTEYFAIARLDPNALCQIRSLKDGCFDITFGPSDTTVPITEHDPGRIRFDAQKNGINGTHVDSDYDFSRIRGMQLRDNGNNTYDILITGPTYYKAPIFPPPPVHRDFYVARVKHDGDPSAVSMSKDWAPTAWRQFIAFDDGTSAPRDDMALDMVYEPNQAKLFVVGVTCTRTDPLNCVDTENSPSSDIAYVRLSISGTVEFSHRVTSTGTNPYSTTYTDVAYSIVLQTINAETKVIIGGYSVDNDSGRPYMSGARFPFSSPANQDAYEFFRSDFPNGGTGQRGDQAWEIGIQSNNRIVAGGFRTLLSVPGPGVSQTFGALRLCPNPLDEAPCEASLGAPGTGGGGPGFGMLPLQGESITQKKETDDRPDKPFLSSGTQINVAAQLNDAFEPSAVVVWFLPARIAVAKSAAEDELALMSTTHGEPITSW